MRPNRRDGAFRALAGRGFPVDFRKCVTKKRLSHIEGKAVFCVVGRLSALTRSGVIPLYRLVNGGPAKCYSLPDIDRHGDCARGGRSAGRCDSVAAFCVWTQPVMRLYWSVLRSVHACCLPHERQTGRLAICSVPVPPWVEIAIRVFSNRWCGYRTWLVHFGLVRFLAAIPTEKRGDAGTESAARRGRTFA